MSEAEPVGALLEWFRRTLAETRFGKVGFTVTMHDGQIAMTERIHTETRPVRPVEAQRGGRLT